MNTPLAQECAELRLGKGRAEKEKKNDRREEAHWTPSIYNPHTSVQERENRERAGAGSDRWSI